MKTCATCAYWQQQICLLTNQTKNLEKDFCSNHKTELLQCETCGKYLSKPIVTFLDTTKSFLLCGKCYEASSTCILCSHGTKCEFEENPSPTPKQVVKTIRQGNAVMQTTVPNPDRIREFCIDKCSCYNANFGCGRQFNHCENQKFILQED